MRSNDMRDACLFFVCMILCTLWCDAGAETITLGQVGIYIDMSCVPDPYVVTHEAIKETHWPEQINCTVHTTTIGHANDVILELHRLDEEINVSVERMLLFAEHLIPLGWSTEHVDFDVAGHNGVLINATDLYYPKMRLICFSPDGDDGWGREIIVARSTIWGNRSIDLFRSIRLL
ncbi:MAG: hypothetical protein H5T42_02315 [Methanothrix sp.]|uniref:hypothetical protein n=1 Tax=Methanothrix sp. TaxID=90426 RepID=UPI00199CA280|nr:hypothetical protein [Methanothrix sp.]MBC7079297.1 hypothetical protein [Methanothrix sp.]NPU86761.1 hypothetical protein [Methanothrix sp.]